MAYVERHNAGTCRGRRYAVLHPDPRGSQGHGATWRPTQTDWFRAAVAVSPVTDWASLYYTSNIAGFVELFLGGTPTEVPQEYASRSSITFTAQDQTPTLLMAGGRDLCTPAEQAE